MGQWSYGYNGYGDLISQTDGKGPIDGKPTTTMTYDTLGRMTSKTDSSGTASWVYDTAPGAGIGKLAAVIGPPDTRLSGSCRPPSAASAIDTSGNRAMRWFTYNDVGELVEASECTDGDTFATDYEYNLGRQSLVRYPQADIRFAVKYHYTNFGFLHYVFDTNDNKVYWQAKAVNALGQVTDEQTGNGVETVSTRSPSTGWLLGSTTTAQADNNNLIQGLAFKYDEAGNLGKRTRSEPRDMADSSETFAYDALDRLTSSQVKSEGYDVTEGYPYDNFGNLTQKGGKSYSYSGCATGGGLHTVCSVGDGTPYSYDANGNMTAGNGRLVTYNGANKVTQISRASATQQGATEAVDFVYGGDGNRVVQRVSTTTGTGDDATTTESARTVYVGLGGTGKSLFERTESNGNIEYVHFIYAGGAHGGNAFALRVNTVTGSGSGSRSTVAMKYNHFDHLGSVTAMSDETGQVVGLAWGGSAATVLAYDAWGARRSPDGKAADPATLTLQTGHREYTGHETIPSMGLVNMNGRVYDPELGRFLSADSNVQAVTDLQSYNRYSYVLNNPLRYTDPTGYAWYSFLESSTFWWNALEVVGLAVACAGTEGTACGWVAAGWMTFQSSALMIASGASWEQVVAVDAIGLLAGQAGGAIGNDLGRSAGKVVGEGWGAVIGGAVAGGVSAAISGSLLTAFGGGGNLGQNILIGISMGALTAGASVASQRLNAVSQASAAGGSGESGSGADKVEVIAVRRSTQGDSYSAGGGSPGSLSVDDLERIVSGDVVDGSEVPSAAEATRQRLGEVAVDVANNDGARYDTNNSYNSSAPINAPKCNIYVRDVDALAGTETPKYSANEWGNPHSRIAGFSVVQDGTVEAGDHVAFSRTGGSPGHVGIVPAGAVGSTPDVLAATRGGVLPTQTFWNSNPPTNRGPTVVWRYNGY